LARADTAVYRHGDLDHLDALLADAPGPTLVVTDVVFSMDGDVAPVGDIAELCRRHGALLVLDEAHSVLSPDLGPQLVDVDVLRVGTLSKTLGALGGFVAGPRPFIELLENRARSYIFTTALTPPDTAAALAALRILSAPEGTALRHRLAQHVERVAPGHPSPIIPVVLGSDERAVAASAALLDRGVWVPAIRPPTVPPGTARLRVTLSAAHTDDHVSLLLDALAHIAPSVAPDGDGTSPRP
jgi:7-keto-8-aminopelargonate synthetase-like enzyme